MNYKTIFYCIVKVAIFLLLVGCTHKISTVPYNEDIHGFKYHNKTKSSNDKLIIFIHGLDGNYIDTWTYKNNNGKPDVYWLDLLQKDPQFKNFDLATLSYPTSKNEKVLTSYDIGCILNQSLVLNDIFNTYKEIHFVAHSLGGIIVQYIVLINENKDYISKIKSVTLLSTPSYGSSIANLADLLGVANEQVKDLIEIDQNDKLKILRDGMDRFMEKVDYREYPKFYFSYESNDLIGMKDINHFDRRDKQPFIMPFSHTAISKPASKEHTVYKYVLQNIIKNSEEKFLDSNTIYKVHIYGYNNTRDTYRLINDISKVVKLDSIKLCNVECDIDYSIDFLKQINMITNNKNNFGRRNRINFNMNDTVLFNGLSSIYGITHNDIRIELVHKNYSNLIEVYLFNDVYADVCYIEDIFLQNNLLIKYPFLN